MLTTKIITSMHKCLMYKYALQVNKIYVFELAGPSVKWSFVKYRNQIFEQKE